MLEDERIKCLQQMAELDEVYLVWKNSHEEFAGKFNGFIKWCPKKVRNYLCGYAESGRLMYQRMVNIACTHMDFIDTNKK